MGILTQTRGDDLFFLMHKTVGEMRPQTDFDGAGVATVGEKA